MTSHRSDETWLGGDPQGKWSNYYELLGLPFGFSDAVVIAQVADQLMKRIRAAAQRDVDTDRLRGLAKSVLEAKSCLTDAERKARYDEELRAQNDSPTATIETAAGGAPVNSIATENIPQAIPVAVPISNAAANVETDSLPFTASGREPISRRLRRRSPFWFKVGTVVVGAGLFTALALVAKHYLLDNASPILKRTPPVVDTNTANAPHDPIPSSSAPGDRLGTIANTNATDKRDEKPSEDRNETPGDHGNESSPAASPHGLEPDKSSITEFDTKRLPQTEPAATPLTRREAEALSSALMAAKRSLTSRDFNAAAESLARAREIARHPKHQDLVNRLEELAHYAHEYWAAIDDAWNELSDGMELQVGNTMVNVVEIDSARIIVRVAGRNRRFTRDMLPSGLRKTIIESWLDPSAASSDVIRGAFHATQDPPDNQAARDHWKLAERRGADVEKLVKILTDSYAVDDLLGEPDK